MIARLLVIKVGTIRNLLKATELLNKDKHQSGKEGIFFRKSIKVSKMALLRTSTIIWRSFVPLANICESDLKLHGLQFLDFEFY